MPITAGAALEDRLSGAAASESWRAADTFVSACCDKCGIFFLVARVYTRRQSARKVGRDTRQELRNLVVGHHVETTLLESLPNLSCRRRHRRRVLLRARLSMAWGARHNTAAVLGGRAGLWGLWAGRRRRNGRRGGRRGGRGDRSGRRGADWRWDSGGSHGPSRTGSGARSRRRPRRSLHYRHRGTSQNRSSPPCTLSASNGINGRVRLHCGTQYRPTALSCCTSQYPAAPPVPFALPLPGIRQEQRQRSSSALKSFASNTSLVSRRPILHGSTIHI